MRGLVPTPGQPLPNLYYESQDGDFVCADITFLRQDFSINLPDKDAGLWPSEQRYDFVTRLRTVPPSELAFMTESSANYPQRDAVLYALRGLTGKDGGDSTATWRELVSLPAGGVVKTKDASLDRISQPPREKSEKLDKSVISTKGKNAEP